MREKIKLPFIDNLSIYYLPSFIKRLLRIDIFNLLRYGNFEIFVLKKKILLFSNRKLVHKVRIDRGSRPLRDGLIIIDNKIFYGDYWRNPSRKACHIYTIDLKNFKKEIFFIFDWVRHIHFIQVDRYCGDSILVGTGDSNRESGIYRINLSTRDIEVLAEGRQQFRACSVIQASHHLFYGSDNPDGDNYIYAFDRFTKSIKPLKKINGPAYYSFVDRNGSFYIATTIEDRKRHQAIIYKSDNFGNDWTPFAEFKKDILPSKLFGYGIIEFWPTDDEERVLNLRLQGLR